MSLAYSRRSANVAIHVSIQAGGIHQRIDDRLISEIQDLVSEGARSVREVRRHLKIFVEQKLYREKKVPPKTKVEVWKEKSPDDNFVFRPYAEFDQCGTDDNNDSSKEEDEDDADADEIVKTTAKGLLFVHQTKYQQRLMKRYGNEITLLDATYKTTKYSLPLFFVVIKTNVDYQIVASFVIQSETSDSIHEAMAVVQSWNSEWKPAYFMVDYSEEEMSAISRLFPGNIIFIYAVYR